MCYLLTRTSDIPGKVALYDQRPKLTKGFSLRATCVQTTPAVVQPALAMSVTCISYVVVLVRRQKEEGRAARPSSATRMHTHFSPSPLKL